MDTALAELLELGFEPKACTAALARAGGNRDAAIELLLSGGGQDSGPFTGAERSFVSEPSGGEEVTQLELSQVCSCACSSGTAQHYSELKTLFTVYAYGEEFFFLYCHILEFRCRRT